jgi:hypothetical protein
MQTCDFIFGTTGQEMSIGQVNPCYTPITEAILRLMGIDQPDIEGEADLLYRRAGLDPATPAPPLWLAEQLLGSGSVVGVHSLRQPGGACLVRLHGHPRIYFRNLLPPERRGFVIGHELAHWCLGDRVGDEAETERACDALAAALIAPRAAFLRALRRHGARFPRLAKAFATSESLVALRFGETTFAPLALVAPRSVRVRGAAYSWPSAEKDIRSMVASSGAMPGLRKAQLRDDPRRCALHSG